jgi:hypothetical protein
MSGSLQGCQLEITNNLSGRDSEMDMHLCRSENLMGNIARSVAESDFAAPLPVADCPAGRRLVERLERPSSAGPVRHSGAVACVAGDNAVPLAQLLAVRTGRRLIEFPHSSHLHEWAATEPVTLVATSAQVSDDFLARISAVRMVGVLTARNLDTLSALVAKSVLGIRAPADHTVSVDTVFTAPGESNPTSLDEFLARVGDGVSMLGMTTHGRQCLMHLDDAVICGRALAPQQLIVETDTDFMGRTSCQWEEGCFRDHWSGDRLLPATEVRASLVFMDVCGTMKTGSSQFDSSTALALSLLEGDVLGVVCSPWTRDGLPRLSDVFCAAVRGGMSLGAAVALANEAVARSGRSVGFFALLGDAGMHPFPEMAASTRAAESGGAIEVPACGTRVHLSAGQFGRITLDGPVIAVRVADDELFVAPSPPRPGPVRAEFTFQETSVGPSISRLAETAQAYSDIWCLGVRLKQAPQAELRRHILECYEYSADNVPAASEFIPRLDAAWQVAAALDHEIVTQLITATAKTQLHLTERYFRHSRREGLGFTACPQCGLAAEINSWQHIVVRNMRRQVLSCHACSELIDQEMANAVEVRLTGPVHAQRGQTLPQLAEITSRCDYAVSGWLGYALLNEEKYGGSLSRIKSFAVTPGSVTHVDLAAKISVDFDLADRHYLRAFAVCAGRVSVYSRAVWISPGAPARQRAGSANGTGRARS